MRKVQIKDIGIVVTGKTPTTKDETNFDGDILFITPADIAKGYIIEKSERTISQKGFDSISSNTIKGTSVLVGCIGSDMGNVAITELTCASNQQINSITSIREEYNPFYIYYNLSLRKSYLRQIAGTTTTPILPKSVFEEICIDFPDRTKQDNVVKICHALDEKIRLNNKINEELEKLAKTLYDYWFVQFDFSDENERPYKSSGGAMVYNNILKREIPIGWEVKNLFEAMDVQYGYPFNTDMFYEESDKDLIPVVRIRDILENTVSAYSSEKVDNKYKLNEKDLVIGMDGNFHMNFWKDNYSYLNQRSVRIRKKESYNISTFQAYYELMPYIKAREKNISRTTVGHLSDKDLKRLNIIIPKTNDNFNPTSVFENLLKKVIVNRKEIANLVTLRDFLLPMLMNGQISITDE